MLRIAYLCTYEQQDKVFSTLYSCGFPAFGCGPIYGRIML